MVIIFEEIIYWDLLSDYNQTEYAAVIFHLPKVLLYCKFPSTLIYNLTFSSRNLPSIVFFIHFKPQIAVTIFDL